MTVTVVLAILATFVTASLSRQQIQARDTERSIKATLIASTLEKYYDEHGEYPSPRALLNTYGGNTGTAVATLLSITDKDILVTPTASASTTNSITASLSTTDDFAYVAQSTVGNDNCQTNIAGGCDEFTLSYKKEVDGSIVKIESTYKGRAGDYQSPLAATSKPTLVAVQSGVNLVATSSTVICPTEGGLSPHYSFRERTGAGSWGSWGSWQTGDTYTKSGNSDSVSYSFQVQVRCESASNIGDTSPVSDPISITYYLMPAAPATPTVNAVTSGTIAMGTSSTVTCNYGTAQYRIDYRSNAGTWATGAWSSGTSYTIAATDATTYGFRSTARCVNGTQTATGATGLEDTVVYYAMPATPAAPTVNATTSGTNVTGTSSAITCDYGTEQYRIDYRTNSGAWTTGSWGTSISLTIAGSNAVNYGFTATARCVNSTQIATGATSAEDTVVYYAMPATPATPTISAAAYGAYGAGTTGTVSCNYGTAQYRIDWSVNGAAWGIGPWSTTLVSSQNATEGSRYDFRSTARCVNNTQIATGSTSAADTYIDPIAAPAAPGVSGATYAAKNWTWSAGSACPAGTWATYQYNFLIYAGSWAGTSWIDAGTGTNATNAAATSQGIAYDIAVHQNCTSSYTSSGWSADTWGTYFYMPVTQQSRVSHAGMKLLVGSYVSVRIMSFSGSCASGVTPYVLLNADYENTGTYLDYGTWNAVTSGTIISLGSPNPAVSNYVEPHMKLRCMNPYTGYYTGTDSTTWLSEVYDIGNLHKMSTTQYNISCVPDSPTMYCAAGFDSGGSSGTTNTTAKACTVKASSYSYINDTNTKWGDRYNFGVDNPCWTTP